MEFSNRNPYAMASYELATDQGYEYGMVDVSRGGFISFILLIYPNVFVFLDQKYSEILFELLFSGNIFDNFVALDLRALVFTLFSSLFGVVLSLLVIICFFYSLYRKHLGAGIIVCATTIFAIFLASTVVAHFLSSLVWTPVVALFISIAISSVAFLFTKDIEYE